MRSASPLDDLVAQTLLGQPEWAEATKARIDAARGRGASRSIWAVSFLPPGCCAVIQLCISAVAAATRTTPERILRRHDRERGRAVAIYLANRHAGLSQKQVGCAFGIRAFAVSKAVAHVERALKGDRKLHRLILQLTGALRGVPQ